MTKTVTYKLQGDGRDSWEIREFENNILVNGYMVYQDPENKKGDALKALENTTEQEQDLIAKALAEKIKKYL